MNIAALPRPLVATWPAATACWPWSGAFTARPLDVGHLSGERISLVHSFANDDRKLCRDSVKARLGLAEWKPGTARPRTAPTPVINADQADHAAQQLEKARLLWRRSTPIAGTVA